MILEPIKSQDMLPDLYIARLLVMLETNPQTNKYRQIILNKKQFKMLSDLLISFAHQYKDGSFDVTVEDKYIVSMPDMVSCFYEEQPKP